MLSVGALALCRALYSPRLERPRRKAGWTLLFGVRHNFVAAIRKLPRIAFETYPTGEPSLDARAIETTNPNLVNPLIRFERRGFMPQEFETCPRWGAMQLRINSLQKRVDTVYEYLYT